MDAPLPKRYLTIDELSAYLGIPVSSIYKRVAAREIPFTPVSTHTYRFDIKAIDKWMEKKLIPGVPQQKAG